MKKQELNPNEFDLYYQRYIDKLGRGLPMVCREAEKLKREVTFTEVGEEFQVVLWF